MSITSANAILTLTVAGLFPTPVQIQGFSVDRAWESNATNMTESQIGVDGRKTAGFIFQIQDMTISLQGDSPSRAVFTSIRNTQRQIREVLRIDGTLDLNSTGESFVLTNGSLQTAKPLPDGQKVLSQMDYVIAFESITGTIS